MTAAWNCLARVWPKRSVLKIRTTRLGAAPASRKIADMNSTAFGPRRGGGEVPVDILDLLLAFLHRLGDVERDRVGRRDVDEEGHAPLLGHRDDRGCLSEVKGPGQPDRAAVDEALGLGAGDVGRVPGVAEGTAHASPRPEP